MTKFSSRLCSFWEFYDKFDGANPQVCMEIGRRPRTFCECAFGDEIVGGKGRGGKYCCKLCNLTWKNGESDE
jgi:hypothetical protein